MKTLLFGIILSLIVLFLAILLEGASIISFLNFPAFLLIFFGTLGSSSASYSVQEIKKLLIDLRLVFYSKSLDKDLDSFFVDLSEISKKNGLLSLEEVVNNVQDLFLQKGIRLIVDGTDPKIVKEILEDTAIFLEEKDLTSSKILETAGGFSPTLGIIGTVMGLVQVLENLNDGTNALGKGIATAFIATFYGIIFANLILFPLANRLKSQAIFNSNKRQAMIKGILSLQSGEHKRIILEKIESFTLN